MSRTIKSAKAQGATLAKSGAGAKATSLDINSLCSVYRYPKTPVLIAGLSGRLKLTPVPKPVPEPVPKAENSDNPDDLTFECSVKDFRHFLQEEAEAGRYNEKEVCATCKKVIPLYLFSLRDKNGLNTSMCRDCKKIHNQKQGAKCEDAKLDDFDKTGDADCRIYKSENDFIGKSLRQEIRSEGRTVDTFEITIEEVISVSNGSITAIGKSKDGGQRNITIFECEVVQLCYEGISLYWSQRTRRLIKKTLVAIPEELFAHTSGHNYAVPYLSNTKK